MAQLKSTTIDDNLVLPNGTTGQRPSAPQPGYTRFNTSINQIEFFNGSVWSGPPVLTTSGTVSTKVLNGYRIQAFTGSGTVSVTVPGTIDILIVAGGGNASGSTNGGGAGAGGLIWREQFPITAGSYTVTVGGSSSNSSFAGLTALAGGNASGFNVPGNAGGSGGGGGAASLNPGGVATQPTSAAGGFGNNGGVGSPGATTVDNARVGGGGGGAGEPGVDGKQTTLAGRGGHGLYFGHIFGRDLGDQGWFAGGGAGGDRSSTNYETIGGLGGGGSTRSGGQPNTGGGAGAVAANGGSGIVIIRYLES